MRRQHANSTAGAPNGKIWVKVLISGQHKTPGMNQKAGVEFVRVRCNKNTVVTVGTASP